MQKTVNDNITVLIILGMLGVILFVISFMMIYIRNRNKMLRQQKKIQEAEIAHQKELLQSVITSQEAERKRIGMDLHDEVGAALSTLRIRISQDAENTPARFGNAKIYKSEIDKIIANMRNISHSLSPRITGTFGFYDAIHELSDSVNRSGNISMDVSFDETCLPAFTSEQAPMALYRVIAELVNNTLKHASAKHIHLNFDVSDSRVQIMYRDDGVGLTPEAMKISKGMGIQNIESRLGILKSEWIIYKPEQGGYGMDITVPLK